MAVWRSLTSGSNRSKTIVYGAVASDIPACSPCQPAWPMIRQASSSVKFINVPSQLFAVVLLGRLYM